MVSVVVVVVGDVRRKLKWADAGNIRSEIGVQVVIM